MKLKELDICRRSYKGHLVRFLVMTLFALAAYANSFQGAFNFDDANILNAYSPIKGLEDFTFGIFLHHRRSVGVLSFALNHYFHGFDVVGYHITNFLIHLINGLLVYFLAYFTFRTPYMNFPEDGEEGKAGRTARVIAFGSALLFLVHPVQTQAVSYIIQRYTSLATLWYLACLLFYVAARTEHGENRGRKIAKQVLWYLLSLVSAFLALRTKEISFTLPFMVLLYEFMFLKRKVAAGMAVAALFSGAGFAALLALTGKWRGVVESLSSISKENLVLSRFDYLCTQFTVITTYLRLLLLPVNQHLDYDYPVYHTFFSLPVTLSFLFLLSILVMGIVFYRKACRTVDESPLSSSLLRMIAFGIFWFFLALSVESSVIPIADVIEEHRLYLPSAGAFLAVTAGMILVGRRFAKRPAKVRGIVAGAIGILALVFTAATFQRNKVWATEAALWQDSVAKAPNLPRPLNNLARVYINRNDALKAIPLLLKANNLAPGYTDTWRNLAIALDRLGMYGDRFRYGEQYMDELGRVKPQHLTEWFAISSNSLGLAYDVVGDHKNAILQYEKALRLAPDLPEAHCNLGLALLAVGAEGRAVEELKRVAVLDSQLARKMALWFYRRGK